MEEYDVSDFFIKREEDIGSVKLTDYMKIGKDNTIKTEAYYYTKMT